MPPKEPSVLIVEDDPDVLHMIQEILEQKGFHVFTAADGESAIGAVGKINPAVVLLDLMLPGMDGFEVCERIRKFSEVPIIIVSAKVEDEDKVKGLESGADDYLTKPFSASELVARIRAALRRPTLKKEGAQTTYRVEDLVIDFARRRVTVGGRVIPVTTIEYKLISHLALNAGRVVPADELLETIWGKDAAGNYHLLQVNVARLRVKLGEEKGNRKYIRTEHGTGYLMVKEPEA